MSQKNEDNLIFIFWNITGLMTDYSVNTNRKMKIGENGELKRIESLSEKDPHIFLTNS